ncbi:MAG: hypothetical protein D6723_06925 [Acidobacteria bacterium]|nr:MAG: hypothetical protein D6723_06925 [Acidobacteriota bacterium]
MKFSYMSPTARFTFGLIIVSLILMSAGLLVIGARGQHYPGIRMPESIPGWTLFGALMTFILLILVSAFFTQHEVTDREIIIRQGILFHGAIPLDNVASVRETLRKPFGLGVRVGPDRTLFVNTALTNLVVIELKRPQRFKVFHLLPLWEMRRVIINLTDPEAFVRYIHDRIAPPESYRPQSWA